MSDSYLQALVTQKCRELGEGAAAYFGVSDALVRQWLNGSKTPSLAAVEKVFVMPPERPAEAGWDAKEVFIAMPVYRTSNPRTVLSLLGVWDRAKFGYMYHWGDAFVAHTRNWLADDFLRSGMPLCWWLDDDIVVPFGNAALFNQTTGMNLPPAFAGVHAPTKLRSRGKSLVGGLYVARRESGRPLFAEGSADREVADALRRSPVDECRPTEWVATGCLMHTRQVLEDIKKAFPHLAPQHAGEHWHFFSGSSDYLAKFFSELPALTDEVARQIAGGSAEAAGKALKDLKKRAEDAQRENFHHSRLQQGEDQTFCKRAKAAGHQPHVDLGVICGHADGSVVWGPHNTRG